jgi:hypothetical protein
VAVKITGIKQLLEKFDDLGRADLIAPSVAEAVKEGAQVFYEAIEEVTPTSTDRWTDKSTSLREGELKSGLRNEQWTTDKGNPAATVKFTSDQSRTGEVSPKEVAGWVNNGHFRVVDGHSSLNKKTNLRSGPGKVADWVEGTFFFTKTVDQERSYARAVTKNRIRKALASIIKG